MAHCVTIAEVLGPAGYRCIQTGKWHLGDKKREWWPLGRGFHRFYGCPQGGGFYFRPSSWRAERYVVRGEKVLYDSKTDPPAGWYSTDAYTDEGLKYVEEAVQDKKPFFWYLAYNAPHFPLQAKPDDIAKYRGRYKAGWDKIRQRRYERLVELGLIDGTWKLSPRDERVPAWNALSQVEQDQQDLRMATYAATIDCVDQNVGKIVGKLRRWNALDNTLILFLHDNGGQAGAGGHLGSNKGKGAVGTAESEVYYGTCWANVSDTPFRKYKGLIHEGGIATPLVAHWPKGIDPTMSGGIAAQPTHLIDILPTCTDIAGATYPDTHKGSKIIPVEGRSLLPILQGKSFDRDKPLFFEHYGNRGLRQGKWKLVADKGRQWELYDLESDRTELNDLAAKMPENVKELSALYNAWADRCFVKRRAR
jgi:arylsulfatase